MIKHGNPNESHGTLNFSVGRRNGRNFKHLERVTRFELATFSLGRKRHTTRPHPQTLNSHFSMHTLIYNNGGKSRTFAGDTRKN